MPLIPIKIPPGFYRNATQYQAKNRWYNGNLVRFSEGRLRPIGGWQRLATTQITKKGAVRELAITNGGTGYSGSGTLTATGGGGTGFSGLITVNSGVIDSATVTNAGQGYTSAPTIVINDAALGTNTGDGNAALVAVIGTAVTKGSFLIDGGERLFISKSQSDTMFAANAEVKLTGVANQ